jgi:hypothetical protein
MLTRMLRRKFLGTSCSIAAVGVGLALSCGGGDREFGGGTKNDAGAGGAADEPTAGNDGGGSSGTGTVGQGGEPVAMAGAPSVGATGGQGGAPDSPPTAECPEGYSDWLSSSFAFPDGDVIGTADFPSYPWVPTGALAIKSGRVQGVGSAIISQGSTIPYTGSRVRFRARFTDSKQTVAVGANTAADGAGGLRITLDAAGELVLGEGAAVRGQVSLEPLESDVDWFVEAVFKGADAVVSVSGKNYPGGAGSELKAELNASGLKGTAAGVKANVRLDSQAGVSPALDELSIARCGAAAPEYEAKLIDTFERANSASLGKAEFPTDAAWTAAADSEIKIVDGALQTSGNLKPASIPLEVPLVGLRIRATVSAVEGASGSFLWADVNFNVAKGIFGISETGFWVWGGSSETSFHTGIFPGGSERAHDGTISTGTKYFAELNRDANVGVITVRSQSYDGPILGAQYAGNLTAAPNPGKYLTVGDEGGPGTRFEDIRVDNYPAE